ncbi:MAG: NAD(P)/FAD-dependent oxidoreductase [Pseudomonadota bacterium]
MNRDVIVIGGGAAGLMCAMTAGQRGLNVVVLEGANKIGKKILMSGGGRCNFTNLHCEPSRFLSNNPNFCISALKRYTQWDFIKLVNEHGIAYHEKTLGQLFCDHSSKAIVAMLRHECEQVDVSILLSSGVTHVRAERHKTGGPLFQVDSAHGTFTAPRLVLATGGLSIPKMGATDFGYRLARQFGHRVLPTRAGLVPFTLSGKLKALSTSLAGVSVPSRMRANDQSFEEGLLFTHRGLSGPAALQVSSYWDLGQPLHVDLLPNLQATDLLLDAKHRQPRTTIEKALAKHLPNALANAFMAYHWPHIGASRLAELSDSVLRNIAQSLNDWHLTPSGTEGYRTAEVTLGGIDTRELSSQSMESTRQPGLYCIGEVVDVTGHLGGFNFQWAWSSAVAAARAM